MRADGRHFEDEALARRLDEPVDAENWIDEVMDDIEAQDIVESLPNRPASRSP